MNLQKRIALSLALVTLLGLTAAGARAETVMRGTFSLPEQAYWGDTLLPAGNYTLSVAKELSGTNFISVRGEGIVATLMAPAGAGDASAGTYLKVDEINGAYVIRELDSSFLGKSYHFAVSKAVRNMTLRGSVAQPVSIPVSANAGL